MSWSPKGEIHRFESSRHEILAQRGERVYQESLSSLIYVESLAQVMCHYVNGVFCYYQWQETHDAAVAARARQELQSWSEAWRYYQTAVPRLPGVASLYRSQNAQSPDSASGAMAELCEAALQTLAARKGNPDSPQAAVTGSSLPLQPMN